MMPGESESLDQAGTGSGMETPSENETGLELSPTPASLTLGLELETCVEMSVDVKDVEATVTPSTESGTPVDVAVGHDAAAAAETERRWPAGAGGAGRRSSRRRASVLARRACLSPRLFLAGVCLVMLGDAVSEGVMAAVATSLEVRYRLAATDLGVLETAFSAGNLAALPVVSYMGGRPGANRPRWIAAGALGMALGTMLTALPQFIFEEYDAGVLLTNGEVKGHGCAPMGMGDDLCGTDGQVEVDGQNTAAYWIMVVGAVVTGLSYAAVPSLALAYIDDNCTTETTALYAGIIESIYGVGSILGFLISSYSLSLWVDFYHEQQQSSDKTGHISPDHPAWVGAWWLGFLVCGALFAVSSVPLVGFPARLPTGSPLGVSLRRRRRRRRTDSSRAAGGTQETTDGGESSQEGTGQKEGLWATCARLMRNPVLLFISLGMMCEYSLSESFGTFLAKYLETQFDITASAADLITGLATVPPYGIGWLLGGLILKKTRMGFSAMFFFSLGSFGASLGCFGLMLFLGCSDPTIVGVRVGYPGQRLSEISVDADCNAFCDCTTSSYQPVCDVTNGVTYISPCFAGCNDTLDNVYYNCSCLQSPSSTPVVAGLCDLDCRTLAPFIVVLILQTTANTVAGVPRLMLLLRFVDPKDKTVALGLNQVFTSIGGILGPIVYALFIDWACDVWQWVCGRRGACLVYDIELYRRNFVGLSLLVGLAAVGLTCPAYPAVRRRVMREADTVPATGGDRDEDGESSADISEAEERKKILTLNLMKKRNSAFNLDVYLT